MLLRIVFPIDFLSKVLAAAGKMFPAAWGYKLMIDNGFCFKNILPLVIIFLTGAVMCGLLLRWKQPEKLAVIGVQ